MKIITLLTLAATSTQVYGFWRMTCNNIQVGRIDPIISPGGIASHVHLIGGPINFNTTSTYDSLRSSFCTSCQIQDDKSAYWTPLMYYRRADGTYIPVRNDGTVVYYLGRGDDSANMVPFPPGLKMVSGDTFARSYDNTTMTYGTTGNPGRPVSDRVSFNCITANYGSLPETPGMVRTDCANGLRAQIQFQSCWDGVNLYKSDQSHVAYLSQIDNGVCPPTHPKLLPHLFYEIYYFPNEIDSSDGGQFLFANGDTTGFGFHGDFLNGWDTQVLKAGIDQCINTLQSGAVDECPPLAASNDPNHSQNCPLQPPLVAEQVTGTLSSLPGCNPPSSGPARASPVACSSPTPSLNPVVNTDGLMRKSPTIGTNMSTPVGSATYQGCYLEGNGVRALNSASYSDTKNMTNEACASYCYGKKFSVFGTEYAQECYCGNSISTSQAPLTDCGMACVGNLTEYCGAGNRLSVWSLSQAGLSSSSISASATSVSKTSTSIASASTLTIKTSSSTTSSSMQSSTSTTVSTTSVSKSSTSTVSRSTLTTKASSSPTSSTSQITTSSTSSAPPTVTNASYLGCYSDNVGSRLLMGTSSADDGMTIEACAKLAKDSNYQYYGVEYGRECYAGNSFSSSLVSSSNCNMACGGDKSEICGGPSALSVFKNSAYTKVTIPTAVSVSGGKYGYMGCYSEGTSGRAIDAYTTSNSNMTVESCVAICYGKGFSYAATEYMHECYCNNAGIVNGGKLAPGGDADCNMLCDGNKLEYCGGSNRLQLYQLKTSSRMFRYLGF